MLKELNPAHFAVKIIKDLGMQLKEGNRRKMRYVLLECKDCGRPFERTVDNAKRRQETQCNTCKYAKQYPMRILQWNTAENIHFECNRCGLDFTQSDRGARKHNRLGLCESCKADDADSSLTYKNLEDKLVYTPDTGSLAYKRELHHLNTYNANNLELKVRSDGRIQFCGSTNVSKARVCLWLYHGYDISFNRPVGFKDGDRNNFKIDNLDIGNNGTRGVTRPDKYTKEYILEIAKKYTSRKEFKFTESTLYCYAVSKGWVQEVLAHMPYRKSMWSLEAVMSEAKLYSTREDFKRGCEGAYDALRKNYPEHRDEAYSHMLFNSSSDNDAVYVWKAVGLKDVYKIGMTSCRPGKARIEYVANASGLEADIVVLLRVNNGLNIEKEMMKIGKQYRFDRKFNGSTEFRELSEEELNKVLKVAYKGVVDE